MGTFVETEAKNCFRIFRNCLLAGLLIMGLSACGSTEWGFPYRATIQQGNWITAEQVDQLEIGMSREQVRFILGSPTLQDALHANRWDYPFYNKPGYGEEELRNFTLWFEHDQLAGWEGDEQPDRQPFQKADSGKDSVQKKASSDETVTDDASTTDASTQDADQAQATGIEHDTDGIRENPIDEPDSTEQLPDADEDTRPAAGQTTPASSPADPRQPSGPDSAREAHGNIVDNEE